MIKRAVLIMFAVLICFGAVAGYAQEQTALSKLSRGFTNLTLGWMELGKQPMKVKQEHGDAAGDVAGLTWGVVQGFTHFIGRTAVGAYEMATFFVPSFEPIIQPEYIFSEEEEKEKTTDK